MKDSDHKLDALKYSLDPVAFIEDIIGPNSRPPFFESTWFHKEWIDLFENNRYVALLAPRNHAKSTVVSSYIIWKICKDPHIKVLIVTINQDMADNTMAFIQSHLEGNQDLIRIFGQQRGNSEWSRDTIRVLKATGQREPTCKVRGLTGGMVGSRADIIILDDITDGENSRLETRRAELRKWFNNTLTPILNPGGKIISIGTKWHEDDIHTTLSKIPGYTFRRYKAVIKEPSENNGKAEVLWPERFPYEELQRLKQQYGQVAFELQYQNEIISTEDSPIRREWIESATDNYPTPPRTIPQPYETYLGVDLASKGAESDYFTISAIAINEGNVYMLDGVRTKASLHEQLELIKSMDSKWTPSAIGIEQAAQQKIIVDEWTATTTLPIIPVKPSMVNDRMSRVQRLSVLFQTSRIFLNPDTKFDQWRKEMVVFPRGAHDDTIDSLSYAIQASQIEQESTTNWNDVRDMIHTTKRDDIPNVSDRFRVSRI